MGGIYYAPDPLLQVIKTASLFITRESALTDPVEKGLEKLASNVICPE